jgi:hypothetical protein
VKLQEVIDELNAIRDEYGGDVEFETYDDYFESYVPAEIEVIYLEGTGRVRIFEYPDAGY